MTGSSSPQRVTETDMATFAFSGRTRGGETVTGERIGDTMDAVVAALRREQIQVTRIQPARPKAGAAAQPKERRKSVPAKNLAVFTRQFSVMIDAGLPLVQCLDILGNQEEHKYFAAGDPRRPATDVEGGASLADAMKRHPKVFDALFTNMIAAGEAGGILDTILKRLAIYIEKAVKLKGQVKSAMIYPIAVIVIAGRRRRRDPVEGHSDLRAACSPASAPSCRCRRASSSRSATTWSASCRSSSSGSSPPATRSGTYYATENGRRVIDAAHAEAADPRPDLAQDRRRAVLPDAVDADGLGRADPRRPRHHRAHRRQRHHRGRHPCPRARASSAARPSPRR